MIFTQVFKSLPVMNDHLKYVKTANEYNAVSHALYHFFNSRTLTRQDYVHLVDILLDKLPVYALKKDLESFKVLVLSFATFNYPACDDFEKVLNGLLTSTPTLDFNLLNNLLYTLKDKLPKCNYFVGIEVLSPTISLNDITEKELASIKKIIMLK